MKKTCEDEEESAESDEKKQQFSMEVDQMIVSQAFVVDLVAI